MNANELADLLEDDYWDSRANKVMLEGAKMLRQQQAEIERLTMLCDCMTTESNRKGNEIEELKAHPVKELTDEEIEHIQAICHLKDVGYDGFIMRFARAILRKAQE